MKQLVKNLLLVTVSVIAWELTKEAAYRLAVSATANDEVDVPIDFDITAEVSE